MALTLEAKKRSETGKAVTALRTDGRMPAVVYGPKQAATAIEVSLKEFSKTYAEAGESTVVELSIDGEKHPVLIHEVDHDPVTDAPRHADFYAIVKGQKVEVDVPLEFIGVSPAVKELNGNLVKTLHELTVEADPMNLPHEIEVDISGIVALDAPIYAKDIALPAGVVLVTGADEVVVTVIEAEEEVVEEAAAAPDMENIGISEERGKKEEEGEAKSE